MTFNKPTINIADYNKWLSDKIFFAESEEMKLDKYILNDYFEVIEQFINSPESKATKRLFELATQVIKKYLEDQ